MKKLIISLFILTALITPVKKAQAVDPKGKAFLIICTYGTVSGALLGFATMAFGTNSRAIAQGASLGLYAGIAFGSYVIMSHKRSLEPTPEPDYNQGPPPGFEDDPGAGGAFGSPSPQDEESGGFFGSPQRFIQIHNDMVFSYKLKNKKGRDFSPPVYLNILNATF